MVDPIAHEVEKYQRKKDRLTQGFIAKMRSLIDARFKRVEQTNKVIQELETVCQRDLADIDRAEAALATQV